MRLLPALCLLAACGLTADQFEDRYENKYCAEYENCFDEFDCDEEFPDRPDTSSCTYQADEAQKCLEGEWQCVTSEGQPFVSIPASCAQVYVACDETSSTITYTGGGTPTGTGS